LCNGPIKIGFRKNVLRFAGSSALLWVLALLTPLAYTAGPDPSWIPGLYDDADLDDVLVRVTSSSAAIDPDPLRSAFSTPLILGFPKRTQTLLAVGDAIAIVRPRAPPVLRRLSPFA